MTTTALEGLTAADRCDRCGARAHLRVTLHAGELLFCAHHAKAHSGTSIEQVALTVHDETDKLN